MENKKTVVFIIILILIILGLGGYIAFDKMFLSKSKEKVVTQIGDVKVDLNVFEQINKTLNTFDSAFNDVDSSYLGYLFSKKEISLKTFDKDAALYAAAYNSLICNNSLQNLPGGVVKSNYESLFDKPMIYEAKGISAGNTYKINYDVATDTYAYTIPKTYNIYSPKYMEKNVETTLEEDNIIIKRKVFFVEYTSENGSVTAANIYKTKDKTNLITTMKLKDNSLNVDELIAKYGTKLSTYKYTFKQKTIDKYMFYSIEEI